MENERIIWQIGIQDGLTGEGATMQGASEFLNTQQAVEVFDYHVDDDKDSIGKPQMPGALFEPGISISEQALERWGTVAAKINIHFTLDQAYKENQLCLFYDRYGSEIDQIELDGEVVATVSGTGEGRLRRFKHVFGAIAEGKHVLSLSTRGGEGKHHIDYLKLTADPEEVEFALPNVVISHINYVGVVGEAAGGEYVEIANEGDLTIDLAGWLLHEAEHRIRYTFPDGATLEPGSSVRVYTRPVDAEISTYSFNSDRDIWEDRGDSASLFDTAGTIMSHYSYGSKDMAKLVDDPQGFLERFRRFGATPSPALYEELFDPDDGTVLHPGMAAPLHRRHVGMYMAQYLSRVREYQLTIRRYAMTGNILFIEAANYGVVGGHPLEWGSVYRIMLRGDRVLQGRAYVDRIPVLACLIPNTTLAEVNAATMPTPDV